jgi:hypothetical protein
VFTSDVRNVGRCVSKANGVKEMECGEVLTLEAANAPILCKTTIIFVMDTPALYNDMRHIFCGSSLLSASSRFELGWFGLVWFGSHLTSGIRFSMRHFVYPPSTTRYPLQAYPPAKSKCRMRMKAKGGGVDSTHSRNDPQHPGTDAGQSPKMQRTSFTLPIRY